MQLRISAFWRPSLGVSSTSKLIAGGNAPLSQLELCSDSGFRQGKTPAAAMLRPGGYVSGENPTLFEQIVPDRERQDRVASDIASRNVMVWPGERGERSSNQTNQPALSGNTHLSYVAWRVAEARPTGPPLSHAVPN